MDGQASSCLCPLRGDGECRIEALSKLAAGCCLSLPTDVLSCLSFFHFHRTVSSVAPAEKLVVSSEPVIGVIVVNCGRECPSLKPRVNRECEWGAVTAGST